MKKFIALALVTLALAGCSSEVYKTGLGSVNTIAKSKAATADAAGTVQTEVATAAVTLDSKGVITNISIDTLQAKVAIDAAGAITTDLSTEFKSKKELGDEYNMKGASPIQKEWYEQIDALEQWAIGKTPDQVVGMAVREENGKVFADEADLTTACTIDIGPILAAVEEAAANAK